MDVLHIIGQGFGILAVVFGLVSFQMRSRKGIMAAQMAVAISFCIHYAMLGVLTACAMNVCALVRNVTYYFRDGKRLSSPVVPFLVAALMGLTGILSFQGWYSILLIIPLSVNSYCMSFKEPNNIRISILFTSPPMLVYGIIVGSIGGAVYQAVIITSSVIGLIRYRKQKRTNSPDSTDA